MNLLTETFFFFFRRVAKTKDKTIFFHIKAGFGAAEFYILKVCLPLGIEGE